MTVPTHVLLWNPAAGARITDEILAIVRQLLKDASQLSSSFAEYQTLAPGHASQVAAELRAQLLSESFDARQPLKVILLGGDGTTQEFLSGLYGGASDGLLQRLPMVQLVLVPTGTANALYSALYPPESSSRHEKCAEESSKHDWRLRSLRAYLRSIEFTAGEVPQKPSFSRLYPLTLTSTKLYERGSGQSREVVSHLVTSHALHAAILSDSEELRITHPGIERFKMAAQRNVTKWIDGQLLLLKTVGEEAADAEALCLQKYDPRRKAFITVEEDEVRLQGPFFYMASMTTDRLEPSFVPAPFGFARARYSSSNSTESSKGSISASLARSPQYLDLILIRPLSDPQVRLLLPQLPHESFVWEDESTLKARQTFAEKRVGAITQGMYDGGRHVQLLYPEEQKDVEGELSEEGSGESVVDYWRVSGWKWTPHPHSARAGLVCLDGALIDSETTSSRVLTELNGKVQVYY